MAGWPIRLAGVAYRSFSRAIRCVQVSDSKDADVIQGLGARRGSDDDMQSTTLANGNIVLPYDRDGDSNAEDRFEARIVSPRGHHHQKRFPWE